MTKHSREKSLSVSHFYYLTNLLSSLFFIPSISNFFSPFTHQQLTTHSASRFDDDRSEDVDIEDAIESLQVSEPFTFKPHTQATILSTMCPGNEAVFLSISVIKGSQLASRFLFTT